MFTFFKAPKSSDGLVEFSFDNPIDKFLINFRKLFKNFSKKIHFSSKCSSGHVECIFDNFVRNFFLVVRKNSLKLRKTKTLHFFSKTFSIPKLFSGQRKRSVNYSAETYLHKDPRFLLNFPNFLFIFQVFLISKVILWRSTRLFWQTCQNFPPQATHFLGHGPSVFRYSFPRFKFRNPAYFPQSDQNFQITNLFPHIRF